MKQNIVYLFCIGLFIIACNTRPADPSKNETKETPSGEVKNDKPANQPKEAECYRFMGNRDTVYLQLSEVYGTMTGMLLIKNSKREQSVGTLQGKMSGDMLLAEYSYKSEGKMSVRQVAFRKIGNDFIEGFGDMSDVNGKTVFKDLKALKYEENNIFTKVPCKN